MQKQAIIFTFLFLSTLVVTLYFALCLSLGIYTYVSLSEVVPAKITRFEIEERGSKYTVIGVYEYKIKEKIYIGSTRLSGPKFINEDAAIDSVKGNRNWIAHYQPALPDHSSLERMFPVGYAIRFFLSICVLAYFWVKKLSRSVTGSV